MLQTSPRALRFIKDHEGYREVAYQCASGVWTIGYGHTSDARYPVKRGMKITRSTAEAMFKHDVAEAEAMIDSVVKVPLNGNQYGALVSLIFNIGNGAFKRSSLLRWLNKGDFNRASREFSKWNKSRGKELPGLIRRRAEEKALFMTPAELGDKVVRQPPIKGATEETRDARDAKGAVEGRGPTHDGSFFAVVAATLSAIMGTMLEFAQKAGEVLTSPKTLALFLIVIVLSFVAWRIYTRNRDDAA
jgi:lysozyme